MKLYRIRLKRIGRYKAPIYSIIVTFSDRSPKTGLIFEKIGFYSPAMGESKIFFLKLNRLAYWLLRGATVSKVVGRLVGRMAPRVEKFRFSYRPFFNKAANSLAKFDGRGWRW